MGPTLPSRNSGGVTNSAISTITTNAGTLQLQDEALTLDQGLTNTTTGYIDVDISGGGSTFNIDGVLDNSNYVDIGNFVLNAATTVTATALDNESGGNTQLQLHGSTAESGPRTTLDLDSTAGFGIGTELTGTVSLDGNALLEFDLGGSISSIASSASLTLGGPEAFVADSDDITHNSALTELDENDGTLALEDSSLAVHGDLNNTGILDVDLSYAAVPSGTIFGGSILNIDGTLTNGPTANSRLYIGDANLEQATTVTAAALDNDGGQLYLTGNTDITPSASGLAQLDIASTAGFGTAGEVTGTVDLTGNALVQFASGSISAIETGAILWLNGPNASVADLNGGANSAISTITTNAGTLQLQDEALTLGQGLTNTTTGYIDVDISGGGSTFNIDGVLDNSNYVDIGNFALSAATTVTATALDNESGGNTQLQLHGSTAAGGPRTTLDLDSTAGFGTGTELTGSVSLDGNALLEFELGGSILSIASGASLTLGGPGAFVADSDDTTRNSALTELDENDGTLTLQDSSLSVGGSFNNTGYLYIDNSYAAISTGNVYGGSQVTIAGTFSNSANVFIGNPNLTAATSVSLGALDNTGSINITGDASGAAATLTIGGTSQDQGGAITVNSGAELDVLATAQLTMSGGGDISGSGTLDNEGSILLQGGGGSGGPIALDPAISVSSIINNDVIEVSGDDNKVGTSAGTITGSGTLLVDAGASLEIAAAVSGNTLQFAAGGDGAVQIDELLDGSDQQEFNSAIAGFSSSDVLVLEGFGTFTTINGYLPPTESGGDTSLTLTDDGTPVATLSLVGDYTGDTFLLNADPNISGAIDLTVVPCYHRGTLILTEHGERPVETLSIGELLITRSGAALPIKWIGRRSYRGRFVLGRKDILPICIRASALDENVPRRDLWISPHHAMYLDGMLIEAKDLINGVSIVQAEQVEKVEYFHIELDSHDVIIAEGALSESFVDDDSRGLFHNAHEYFAGHPQAPRRPAVYCAPRPDGGYVVETARRRIDARAGLRPIVEKPASTLRGYVDVASVRRIAGWAQNPEHPEAPVCLDISVGGRLIEQVLANRYREDLQRAGLGSGHHGFELALPAGLAVTAASVEVRRSLDGAALAFSADARRALALGLTMPRARRQSHSGSR